MSCKLLQESDAPVRASDSLFYVGVLVFSAVEGLVY